MLRSYNTKFEHNVSSYSYIQVSLLGKCCVHEVTLNLPLPHYNKILSRWMLKKYLLTTAHKDIILD